MLRKLAAQAVKAGTDLECGVDYKNLMTAVERGILKERISISQQKGSLQHDSDWECSIPDEMCHMLRYHFL